LTNPEAAIFHKAACYITGRLPISTRAGHKQVKCRGTGWVNAGLTLSPHKEAGNFLVGRHTLCQWSTKGCRIPCVGTAGRGSMDLSKLSRIARTLALAYNEEIFVNAVATEIVAASKLAGTSGLLLAYRTNLASDLTWLAHDIAQLAKTASPYPITFYDYTKNQDPFLLGRSLYVTRAHSHHNMKKTERLLPLGLPISVVFDITKHQPLPTTWMGSPVIDGVHHDLWFLDAEPYLDADKTVIVGLRLIGSEHKKNIARAGLLAVQPAC